MYRQVCSLLPNEYGLTEKQLSDDKECTQWTGCLLSMKVIFLKKFLVSINQTLWDALKTFYVNSFLSQQIRLHIRLPRQLHHESVVTKHLSI